MDRDIIADFGEGIPEDIYLEHFRDKFPKYLLKHSSFSKILLNTSNLEINFKDEVFDFGENAILKIKIPNDKKPYSIDGIVPDFILIIQNLKIFKTGPNIGPDVIKPYEPSRIGPVDSYRKMVHRGKMLIWDNLSSKKVAYGLIHAPSSISSNTGQYKWNNALEEMTKTIIKNSPFKMKRLSNVNPWE